MFDIDEEGNLHVMPAKKAQETNALIVQSQAFTKSLRVFHRIFLLDSYFQLRGGFIH